jgi:hypothetical protein
LVFGLKVRQRVAHAEDQVGPIRHVRWELQQTHGSDIDFQARALPLQFRQKVLRCVNRKDAVSGLGQWDRVHAETSTKIDSVSTGIKELRDIARTKFQGVLHPARHPHVDGGKMCFVVAGDRGHGVAA